MFRRLGEPLNKAKRGERKRFLPIGYGYDLDNRVVKTPDIQVRECIDRFFSLFRTLESGYAVVNYYAENDMKFPLSVRGRGRCSEVLWEEIPSHHEAYITQEESNLNQAVLRENSQQWEKTGKRSAPLPIKEWKAENDKLTAEKKTLNQRYLALKEEVKEAVE